MVKILCSILLCTGVLSSTVIAGQGTEKDAVSIPVVDTIPLTTSGLQADTAILPISNNALAVTVVDSVKPGKRAPLESKPLSFRSVVVPSAMIGIGAFAFTSKGLKDLNLAMRERLWESRNDGHGRQLHIDDATSVAPAIAVYGLNIAGVKGKNNLLDRSMMLSMSYLIGHTLIVKPIKKLSKVIRPDSSNYYSFPSGHTAQAFISAEFLRQEYKHLSPWYGIAGYTAAIGTGFLRMYNNKHWFNDVIAGAGVGILSTRISYWLYPKIKNSFLKKFKGNTVVAPTYNRGAFGIGVVHHFR